MPDYFVPLIPISLALNLFSMFAMMSSLHFEFHHKVSFWNNVLLALNSCMLAIVIGETNDIALHIMYGLPLLASIGMKLACLGDVD